MTAVAYLRKSRVTSERQLSWEVQLSNVTEMASRHGHEPEVLFDWNKSGRKGAEGRPGYAELLRRLEAGEIDTIYSYSLSRLSRSLTEYTRLAELCAEKGVVIRLVKEGEMRYDTVSGRLVVGMLALVAQMEAELAQERARDVVATRRARGDKIGQKPYEHGDLVVKAYDEAGSLLGASKLLTSWGVKTARGQRLWEPSTVRKILARVAPDALPPVRMKGAKNVAPYLFYRLLTCHCGKVMTGDRSTGLTRYRCTMGRTDVLHGKQTISEAKLVDWMMAEAELLEIPDRELSFAQDVAEQQEALRERMTRLGRAHLDGLIVGADYEEEKASITAALAALDVQGRSVRIEPINWDREPAAVNQALRALWHHVQLDEDLRPVFADWTVPGWRRVRPAA